MAAFKRSYLNILMRGENIEQPEGRHGGRINGGQQEVGREPLHVLLAHTLTTNNAHVVKLSF
jgi:hypothetical protein